MGESKAGTAVVVRVGWAGDPPQFEALLHFPNGEPTGITLHTIWGMRRVTISEAASVASDKATMATGDTVATARREALEEAAKICESLPETTLKENAVQWNELFNVRVTSAKDAANRIRALIDAPAKGDA